MFSNHAKLPVVVSNSNNSGDDNYMELFYAGTKTFSLNYFGDIYARKLQLRGIEVSPTSGRPVGDGEEGHFAFDNYRFAQWRIYQYVSGAWRGIAQKRVLTESGKNRPKNLGEADTGYLFIDKDITPDGKPIW